LFRTLEIRLYCAKRGFDEITVCEEAWNCFRSSPPYWCCL